MFLQQDFNGIIEESIFIQVGFQEVIQGLVNTNDISIFEAFKFIVMCWYIDGADALQKFGIFPAKMVQFVAKFVSFSGIASQPMIDCFVVDSDGALKNLSMEFQFFSIWSWIYALGVRNDLTK